MINKRTIISLVLTALITAVMAEQGCSKPESTSTGNPSSPSSVNLKLDSFNSTVSPGLSVASMVLCFKRLRLKGVPGTADSGNINLQLGEVLVGPAGADLSSVEIPAGTFSRIEFDLDTRCPSGNSLSVTNGNGTFNSTTNITIRFDGIMAITGGAQDVDLMIQQIVNALATVTNNADVTSAAESAPGSF